MASEVRASSSVKVPKIHSPWFVLNSPLGSVTQLAASANPTFETHFKKAVDKLVKKVCRSHKTTGIFKLKMYIRSSACEPAEINHNFNMIKYHDI